MTFQVDFGPLVNFLQTMPEHEGGRLAICYFLTCWILSIFVLPLSFRSIGAGLIAPTWFPFYIIGKSIQFFSSARRGTILAEQIARSAAVIEAKACGGDNRVEDCLNLVQSKLEEIVAVHEEICSIAGSINNSNGNVEKVVFESSAELKKRLIDSQVDVNNRIEELKHFIKNEVSSKVFEKPSENKDIPVVDLSNYTYTYNPTCETPPKYNCKTDPVINNNRNVLSDLIDKVIGDVKEDFYLLVGVHDRDQKFIPKFYIRKRAMRVGYTINQNDVQECRNSTAYKQEG
jgi:hypothetical protein